MCTTWRYIGGWRMRVGNMILYMAIPAIWGKLITWGYPCVLLGGTLKDDGWGLGNMMLCMVTPADLGLVSNWLLLKIFRNFHSHKLLCFFKFWKCDRICIFYPIKFACYSKHKLNNYILHKNVEQLFFVGYQFLWYL